MYGISNSETYEQEHENLNASTILTNLEKWYELEDTFNEKEKSMLADVIWCNDKSITAKNFTFDPTLSQYSGLGFGKEYTWYGAVARLASENKYDVSENPTTTLICPDASSENYEYKNISKFTSNDTVNGNGNLKYNIGMLSIDEIIYAGQIYGPGTKNCTFYLYSNSNAFWWTLTPNSYRASSNDARVFVLNDSTGGHNVSIQYGLRPSIALISNIKITNMNQNGTISNPYIIAE